METDKLTQEIRNLDFEEKRKIYGNVFSFGYLWTNSLNDRLVLISLVALVSNQMKLKDPKVTTLQILIKITNKEKDNSAFYKALETLSILVDDFSYGIKVFDPCGFKTSQEIINKIKELLNTWMPF